MVKSSIITEFVKLGDVVELISGRDLPVRDCNNKALGLPYILGASNLIDNQFFIERWTETPTVIGKKDDILLTVKGTIGKMHLLQEEEIHLSRQVMALRNSKFNNLFVYYFMIHYMEQLKEKARGVIPGISRTDILSINIPNMSRPEQQRIVNRIESLFEKIDKAETLINEAREGFEKRKEAILTKAFRGELTEKWRDSNRDVVTAKTTIKQAYEMTMDNYNTLKKEKIKGLRKPEIDKYYKESLFVNIGEKPNWIKTRFVHLALLKRGFDLPSSKRIKGEYPILSSGGVNGKHREFKVTGPCVTVGRSGSVGRTYYSEVDTWPLNTVLYVEDFNGNYPKYVYYYFLNFDFTKYSSSTAVPTLNRNNFTDIEVEIPPYDEQRVIAGLLDKFFENEKSIERLSDIQNDIILLKKSILAKAFRGELGTNNMEEDAISI